MIALFRATQIPGKVKGPSGPSKKVVFEASEARSPGASNRAVFRTTGGAPRFQVTVVTNLVKGGLSYRAFELAKLDHIETIRDMTSFAPNGYTRLGPLTLVEDGEAHHCTAPAPSIGSSVGMALGADIGAATGQMLLLVKDNGWELVTVESGGFPDITLASVTTSFSGTIDVYRVWWVLPNALLQSAPEFLGGPVNAELNLTFVFESSEDFIRVS